MRQGILSLALAISLVPVFAYADPPLGKFRGLQFGEDLRSQLPECAKQTYLGTESYKSPYDKKETCWQCTSHNPEGRESCDIYFFDTLPRVPQGYAVQQDSKLGYLSFDTPSGNFLSLATLLREKYGTPDVDQEKPWQSQGGIKTTSHLLSWRQEGLEISLEAPAESIDKGRLRIFSQEWLEETERQDAKEKARQLKDL